MRYPILEPTGWHKPVAQVERVEEPDRANEVDG